jgi:gamma-glutamyltranspeptidase/glutathione hydrolase
VWQVLSNVLDFGMQVGPAVASPRFHHQHLPDAILIEAGAVDDAARGNLEKRGHRFRDAERDLGCAPTIVRREDVWTGAPDPRCGGLAAGVD